MTTNTTNNQDIDDLLCDLFEAGFDSPSRNQSTQDYRKARDAILAHIKAKLAQAHQTGYEDAFNTFVASNVKFKERAEIAESRLAEIQRGVEGLTRYEFRTGFKLDVPAAGILPDVLGNYVMFEDVEALLTPQGQASDTSGLPG